MSFYKEFCVLIFKKARYVFKQIHLHEETCFHFGLVHMLYTFSLLRNGLMKKTFQSVLGLITRSIELF